MFDGPMWKIAYDFKPAGTNGDGSAVVYGQLWREKHPNGIVVSTLIVNAKASNGYNSRTETRGDNPTGAGNPSRTFTYNTYRLKTSTDFKGAVGTQNYDNNYYLQSVVDRNGNTTGYACKAFTGMVKEVDYPSTPGDTLLGTPQTILSYGYDDDNNPYYLHTITNGYTNVNSYNRDVNHQITKITYPDTNNEQFTYNSFGQKLTHTLRDSSVETWQYDTAGRVTNYWDAAHPTTGNPTTRYLYDSYGRVWKTTEGRGAYAGDSAYTTIFEYNARGELTKLTHPDGTYIQNSYNPNGTLASTTDELNHATTSLYDDYKRVRSVTTPTSHTSTTFYDQARSGEDYTHTDAKPTKTLSPMSRAVNAYYDENLRIVRIQQAPGTVDEANKYYGYDANGNRTTVTDPNGKVTTTYYDKQNRVKFMDDPMVNDPVTPHKNSDNHTMSYTYDEGGNKIRERRSDSKICKYTYNKMGRLATKSGYATDTTPDPFPDIITYSYDALGDMTQMDDPLGRHYKYTYDGLKRKLTAQYPNDASGTLRTETFHYDVANHMDSYTNPAGQTETLVYDNRGHLTQTSWSSNGPTVTTAYDAASRPTSVTTSDGTGVVYGYDNANLKIYEDQTVAGFATRRVQTDPDADGNRSDLLVTTGGATNFAAYYDYTNRNQLLNIYDSNHTAFFRYSYDPAGNVTQRLGQRLQDTTVMQYNPVNRPILASQTGLSGSALETMNYEYTGRGNLRDQYLGGGTTGDSFTYDDRDQLINALYSATGVSGSNPNPQNPQRTVSYDCGAIDRNAMTVTDSNGTTNTNYTKDNLNQYTQINSQTLSYDGNFNLTGYAGWSYAYNAINRMVSVGGNGTATFLYDGTGRCVKRVINGATTVITYDGWRPVAEWDQNGNLVASNVYGTGMDEPLYTSNASGQFYYKLDGFGNVRFLLNASGMLIEQYTYDAFGTPIIKNGSGTVISGSAVGNRFMFKGREYLGVLGLYDNRRRMYHPGIGKFMQVDPVGFNGDPLNLFRFCNHNPLTRSDAMGEDDSDYLDPYIDDFGFDDPFFDPFPAFFGDQGALDAPVPLDPTTIFPPGGSAGAISSTTITQTANVGQGATVWPGLSGDNIQSGSQGQPTSPSALESVGSNSLQALLGGARYFSGVLRGITIPAPGIGGDAAQETFNEYVNGETLLNAGLLFLPGIGEEGLAAEECGALESYLNGAGGRLGGSSTRLLNNSLATSLEEEGYTVVGGAGRASEEWIPGAGGSTQGGTWVDLTATNGSSTIRLQTISTLSDGITPTMSEAAAAARIKAAFPNDPLFLVPKK